MQLLLYYNLVKARSSPNFAKFFCYVEMDQTTLDHRDQIALIIRNHEANRATAPGS